MVQREGGEGGEKGAGPGRHVGHRIFFPRLALGPFPFPCALFRPSSRRRRMRIYPS
jgi:hypothetical protein